MKYVYDAEGRTIVYYEIYEEIYPAGENSRISRLVGFVENEDVAIAICNARNSYYYIKKEEVLYYRVEN